MEVVEEWIAARRQRPYVDDRALPWRYYLFAVELGALKFGRHLACILDAQLELHPSFHVQGARFEPIVVDRKGIARLLSRPRRRSRRQRERRGKQNSSVPKHHPSTQRITKKATCSGSVFKKW